MDRSSQNSQPIKMVHHHRPSKQYTSLPAVPFAPVVDVELVQVLEEIREHFNQPLIITEPNRCPIS